MDKLYIIFNTGISTCFLYRQPKITDIQQLDDRLYEKGTVHSNNGKKTIGTKNKGALCVATVYEVYTKEELAELGYFVSVTGTWEKKLPKEEREKLIEILETPNKILETVEVSLREGSRKISDLDYKVCKEYSSGLVTDTIAYTLVHSEGDYYSFRVRLSDLSNDDKIIDCLNEKIEYYKRTLVKRIDSYSGQIGKELVVYLKLVAAKNKFLRNGEIDVRGY